MMQENERDLLEVMIFDEVEETVGIWLRAIIQRLEKEQTAIRRDLRQAANLKRRNVDSNAPLPEAPSEVPEAGGSDCVGPTATSSSDFGPIRFWSTRVKAPLQSLP
jgi:hypothetical protein